MLDLKVKTTGFVRTPEPIARELVSWAIRSAGETVLDLGAGEGVFLHQAAGRLEELGSPKGQVARAIFGVERDPALYARTASSLRAHFGVEFSGVYQGDLFECEFPAISAIVGNPPYVRRSSLPDVDSIHKHILHRDVMLGDIPRLADLYAYFLVYAERFLVPGGRLAVIISSSWLDTRSGAFLKRFLMSRFRIHAVVACEARMFEDALVKSVLLLAEKGTAVESDTLRFVRISNFRRGVLSELDEAAGSVPGTRSHVVTQSTLREDTPWSIYLRTPCLYFSAAARMPTHLGKLVESRIGIQPLARDFFVLPTERARAAGLHVDHLQPLAYSPRHVEGAVIERADGLPHRLLCTRQPRDVMDRALRSYVEEAEKAEVPIRGKDRSVHGYQNVPRLQQAGRQPWYNLADEVERRGRYTIFVPRRFYETFVVVWNKAGAIAGENFIELRPKNENATQPLLAILNSSFFELVARCHAQQYGGGIFNLNPVDVKLLPIFPLPDEEAAREALAHAFERFAQAGTGDEARRDLDAIVGETFGFGAEETERTWQGVLELRSLGRAAKRVHTGSNA